MSELDEIRWRKAMIEEATEQLEEYIKTRWPVGSPISWVKGGAIQCGDVLDVARGSVRVKNAFSGANYWIDIYWVERALEMTDERVSAAA